jgi:hypothetical protein
VTFNYTKMNLTEHSAWGHMYHDAESANAEIGRRLQAMLARKRWTAQALERRSGLGHTTVSHALNGRSLPLGTYSHAAIRYVVEDGDCRR